MYIYTSLILNMIFLQRIETAEKEREAAMQAMQAMSEQQTTPNI